MVPALGLRGGEKIAGETTFGSSNTEQNVYVVDLVVEKSAVEALLVFSIVSVSPCQILIQVLASTRLSEQRKRISEAVVHAALGIEHVAGGVVITWPWYCL